MARQKHPSHSHLREHIAQLAARLAAEGVEDFALAKRKAARQLDVPDTQSLPNNGEIEHALRAHQALFQREDQVGVLRQLRAQALRVMHEFEGFAPCSLALFFGAPQPLIPILISRCLPIVNKEIALFLLNRNQAYKASEKRFRFSEGLRPIPVLLLSYKGEADIQLAIFALGDRRCMPLSSIDGRVMSGARMSEVKALLDL